MTELQYAALKLRMRENDTPTTTTAEARKKAEKAFDKWLQTMPEELQFDIESESAALGNAWLDSSYELGFIAGARLMMQILTEPARLV